MTKIEYDKDLFELFSKLLDNEIEKMLLVSYRLLLKNILLKSILKKNRRIYMAQLIIF